LLGEDVLIAIGVVDESGTGGVFSWEMLVVVVSVVAFASAGALVGGFFILVIQDVAMCHNLLYVLSSRLRSSMSGQAKTNHTNGSIRMLM
jgi:hypothetical protein